MEKYIYRPSTAQCKTSGQELDKWLKMRQGWGDSFPRILQWNLTQPMVKAAKARLFKTHSTAEATFYFYAKCSGISFKSLLPTNSTLLISPLS